MARVIFFRGYYRERDLHRFCGGLSFNVLNGGVFQQKKKEKKKEMLISAIFFAIFNFFF